MASLLMAEVLKPDLSLVDLVLPEIDGWEKRIVAAYKRGYRLECDI